MKLAGPDLLLSPSTGKSPVHSRSHIQRLCFVGNLQHDSDTRALIEKIEERWPQVEILYSPTGLEHTDDSRLVFFFKDFTGEAFDGLLAENDTRPPERGLRLVGPLYIQSRLNLASGDLYNPKPKRPLFSVQMATVMVVIASDLNEKKRYARFVQFMGGRVKKGITEGLRQPPLHQKPTIYVGTKLTKDQRKAAFLKIPTLRPEWIDKCWQKRFQGDFNVLDPRLLEHYAMYVFQGLQIAFVGFAQSEVEDMAKSVDNNGGVVLHKCERATHIVCMPQATEQLNELKLGETQIAVTDNWLWQSINLNRCLAEGDYALLDFPHLCDVGHHTRTQSKDSLADCERSKGSDDFSSDDLDTQVLSPTAHTPNTPVTPKSPSAGYNKRQQVIMELLETEKNYVNALNLALKFKHMIETDWVANYGEEVINKADLQMVFGRIQPIISVHSEILEKVQRHVDSWSTRGNISRERILNDKQTVNELAEIWIMENKRLLAAYPPYINSYENGKAAFEAADQKSMKFHAFIRGMESDPQFNRNKLTDLLIRPVQRLPSVTLLLKELQKRLTKQEQIKKIGDAVVSIQEVLNRANTVRFNTDKKIAHLVRFTDMDKVPDHLVCSRRQFMAEMDAISIIGTGDFAKWPKTDVRILCFHDVIVVCKTREPTATVTSPNSLMPPRTPTGTLSRLKKQASMSTLRKTHKKPLKYVKHIPIQFIREIRELRDIDPDGGPLLYNPPESATPIMVLTIREDTSQDLTWIIHPLCNRAQMNELFKHIQQQVQMEFGRSVRQPGPYPLSELMQISEIDSNLKKYLRKLSQQNSQNMTLNMTMSRGGNMLRRAISSASMSVASRLTKMTSRNNLREIMEASPQLEQEILRRAPVTPAYDPHPRIDAHSSPDLLDATGCITPKRGLRSRFSNLNLTDTLFRRPSIMNRRPSMTPSFIQEENKEN